jgi:branched-chain amino acid transport system permease protein
LNYVFEIAFQLCIYASVLISLDFILGKAGLLSAAQAAVYGTGAYVSGIVAIHSGGGFFMGLGLAVIAGALFSPLLAYVSLRVSDEALVLVSLAFQLIWSELVVNLADLTGGPMGLRGITNSGVFGLSIDNPGGGLIFASIFLAVTLLVSAKTEASPFGRALRAARESAEFLAACGKESIKIKAQAFSLAGMIAAGAGCLYARHAGYISPGSFDLGESIRMVTALILGGLDSRKGPVAGAVVLIGLPEALRFLGLSGPLAANLNQVIYAAILIAILIARPKGLWGRYAIK